MKKFEEIERGSQVYLDSNIFIYHFTGVSDECSYLLERCENEYVFGVTSVNVLIEILHRLMMAEAVKKRLVKPPRILQKLKEKPEKVCRLNDYFASLQAILDMGIKVYPIHPEILRNSQAIRAQYGLLVNDSLIAAIMKDEGIENLASNDEAFSRVDWIKLYRPGDLWKKPGT